MGTVTTNFGQRSDYPFPVKKVVGNKRSRSKKATPRLLGVTIEAWPGEEEKDREPWMSEIVDGVFLGNLASVQHRDSDLLLKKMGITAVITVLSRPVSSTPNHPLLRTIPLKDRLFLRAEDTLNQDLLQFLPGVCDFIDQRLVGTHQTQTNPLLPTLPPSSHHAADNFCVSQRPQYYTSAEEDETDARSEQEKPNLPGRAPSSAPQVESKKKERILVHCRRGISRSAAVVIAYIMWRKRSGFERVLRLVQRARPSVFPNPAFREQLDLWYDIKFKLYCNEAFRVPCKEYAEYLFRLRLEKAILGG